VFSRRENQRLGKKDKKGGRYPVMDEPKLPKDRTAPPNATTSLTGRRPVTKKKASQEPAPTKGAKQTIDVTATRDSTQVQERAAISNVCIWGA